MRITKKGQKRLLLSCLISAFSLTGAHAEPILAPVAKVELNEALPPWAARPDIQTRDYSNQTEELIQDAASMETKAVQADLDPNATMPLPPASSFDSSSNNVAPLTLEDSDVSPQSQMPLESNDYQQADNSQKQVKKKTLFGKLFSRKHGNDQHKVASDTTGIEKWYQNRNSNVQASVSASNLETQATQGDSDAQYQLGLMYRSGNGVEENVYQAIHWLTRAANADNSQAQYALAMIYRENATQMQDQEKAVTWFKRAAQNSHADAQYSLGLLYANGDNVQQDSMLAKKWFKQSAEQGNMAAKIALATTESTPLEVTVSTPTEPLEIPTEMAQGTPLEMPVAEDNAKITEITTPSQSRFTNLNNSDKKPLEVAKATVKEPATEEPQEQIRVASITAPTPLPPQVDNRVEESSQHNPKPSVSPSSIAANINHDTDSNIDTNAIRQAAMAGDAKSQLLYGSLYEDSKGGLSQDYKESAFWYKKAADQGNAQAQYNLGLLYEDGKGVTQDYYEASQWYKRASNNGFSEAQNNLGVLYIMGKGVIKDRNRAELMFRRASEQGNANAERNLNMLLKESSK